MNIWIKSYVFGMQNQHCKSTYTSTDSNESEQWMNTSSAITEDSNRTTTRKRDRDAKSSSFQRTILATTKTLPSTKMIILLYYKWTTVGVRDPGWRGRETSTEDGWSTYGRTTRGDGFANYGCQPGLSFACYRDGIDGRVQYRSSDALVIRQSCKDILGRLSRGHPGLETHRRRHTSQGIRIQYRIQGCLGSVDS